jgi:hypothetical protein
MYHEFGERINAKLFNQQYRYPIHFGGGFGYHIDFHPCVS